VRRLWRAEGVGDRVVGKGEYTVDGDGKLDTLPSLERLPCFVDES